VTEKVKSQTLGRSVPRLDGLEKVTGKAKFGADIYLQRMLHGKILRSKYPHARILSIDTRKAERLPVSRESLPGKIPDDGGMYQNN
jgi:CO/xanthine dehydrogenase Mo-binding subunit